MSCVVDCLVLVKVVPMGVSVDTVAAVPCAADEVEGLVMAMSKAVGCGGCFT